MQHLLNEHEKDFFLAYKTHMYTVQREIKTLRVKADHEEAKTREDTTIKALEGELDWFTTEALRLDELCTGYKKEVDKWKQKAEALDEDRRFLEDQIKGAKRQNKILRAAAERARSSAYSALMVTKAKADMEAGQLATTGASTGQLPRAELTQRPSSATGGPTAAANSERNRMLQARAMTPDSAALPLVASASASGGGLAADAKAYPPDAMAPSAVTNLSQPAAGALALVNNSRHVLGSDAETRYIQAIQHLKEQIMREQHTVRMLQATRATSYTQKSELEEFFLKCIDEARKELMRRRHMSLHKEKTEKEMILEAMLNNEDVLVCLYEKLFPHRTGIARSLGEVGSGAGGDKAQGETRRPAQSSLEASRAKAAHNIGTRVR
jgi:hypothetical protein